MRWNLSLTLFVFVFFAVPIAYLFFNQEELEAAGATELKQEISAKKYKDLKLKKGEVALVVPIIENRVTELKDNEYAYAGKDAASSTIIRVKYPNKSEEIKLKSDSDAELKEVPATYPVTIGKKYLDQYGNEL